MANAYDQMKEILKAQQTPPQGNAYDQMTSILKAQKPQAPISPEDQKATEDFYQKILSSTQPQKEPFYAPLFKNVTSPELMDRDVNDEALAQESEQEEASSNNSPQVRNTQPQEIKQRQDAVNKTVDMNKLLQDPDMRNALDLQRQGLFSTGIGRAGANLANALAGVKSNVDNFSDAERLANLPVEQLKDERKAAYEKFKQGKDVKETTEMDDSNSDTSKRLVEAAQSLLREQGLTNVADRLNGLSGTQINAILPTYAKAGAAKMMREEKKNRPSETDKEQAKENVKIHTENRKERRQLSKDIDTWNSLEKTIDDAISKAKSYSKNNIAGTGAYAKLKGYTGALSPETQSLETSLQKLSLDQMVKQFSGMSKAIDTPAERAQFETTVPSLGMDDKLLMTELLNRKKAVQNAKRKIQEGLNSYDKYGHFTNESKDDEPSNSPKNITNKPKQIIQNGHTYILNETTGEYE